MRRTLFIVFFIHLALQGEAQQRTKIGLSLSGGGAKGLAHIGLLKVIDSAGIKIDYIAGTSMGAVVGGLYAIGYSGKDLEQIVKDVDWEMLMSNSVPLNEINVEEKDEFGRYLAELPIVGMKPAIPLGAIKGQQMNKLLADLTFRVHQINNFDSLPIPFRCVGADILTGEPVVMKSGYLPTVMRASSAIPSVFTPVKVDGRLLVDGGLIHNFPVKDVKEMGADIVIGGYTGGRLYGEEQLNSALKLIYQSASFVRIADSKAQMKLCDVLADYDLELENYSTASFKDVDSIISIGYKVAMRMYPRLKHIADSLNMASYYNGVCVEMENVNTICISKINIEGADKNSEPLIRGKLGMKEGGTYRISEINDMVDCVYGTRFFDKVYYTLEATEFGNEITVHARNVRSATFKFGLHYDNEQAAGILANFTLRNKLGKGSRIVATLDIAEFPKFRINYQKFINKSQNLWVKTGYNYQFLPYRLYNFGRLQEELTNGYNNLFLGLNYTINKNSYIGVNLYRESNIIRTKIYPEDQANPDTFAFRVLNSKENAMGISYVSNTLNRFLFPTSGHKTLISFKYIPKHKYTINYYIESSTFPGSILEQDITVTPALKLTLSHNEITPIRRRVSWLNNFFAGLILDDIDKSNQPYSEGALPGLFFIGGVEQRQRENTVPFMGFREAELVAAQALVYTTGMQCEVLNKFFVTPTISLQASGINYHRYFNNIHHFNFNYQDFSQGANHSFGYGITFAYDWFGGPLSMSIYRSSRVSDFRGYFTYGYKF